MRASALSFRRLSALLVFAPALISCGAEEPSPIATCVNGCGDEALVEAPAKVPHPDSTENADAHADHSCTNEAVTAIHVDFPTPGESSLAALGPTTDADYLALTAGVTTVDSGPATVSALVVYGNEAFPLLKDEGGRVFAAASRSGLGKVLAFGHNNYINATVKTGDATKILLNAIPWMSNKAAPVIALESSLTSLAAALQAAGYQTKYATPSQLAGVNIYINQGYTVYSDADYAAIRNFVSNGGGLIVGAQGWSFAGDNLTFSANRMLAGTGIVISKLYDITPNIDTVSATPLSPLLNASYASDRLVDTLTGVGNLSAAEKEMAAAMVERAVSILPLTAQDFYSQLAPLLAKEQTITAANPLSPAGNPAARAAARIRYKYTQDLPAADITAHPSAADFPGTVAPNIPRESMTVQIDGTYVGRDARWDPARPTNIVWRSTGAYANAGEMVTVTVPAALVNNGTTIQIGPHTDQLWAKTSYVRYPAIVRSYPITSTQMTVSSAFGGLIYISLTSVKNLGPLSITLDNVVRAPLYVHGQTTLNDWLTIRDYPAPWADVGSDKMQVTVPSSYIRTLADPAQVMNRWDEIMDNIADLASMPRARPRAERFVIDRDIRAGYMHANYPIMAPYAEAANSVSYASLATNWGMWHEVGHNHQWAPWMLQGTTESSVNWYSVYVSEQLFNLPRAKGHTALTPESRQQRMQTYVANGKNYATWGSDAWLPLEMYLQLQQWFGWGPFIQLNADYQLLTTAQSPTVDQAKLDTWTLRFAQNVGKNLAPFFVQTWGLPVSQAVQDQMALLAPWPATVPPIDLEVEPNETCAQAQQIIAPVFTGTYTLSAKTDVDWFVLPVAANQVGKQVHVVTSAGQTNTDTQVEVFGGTCAGLTTMGGPSPDTGVHEDWKSTPLTQSGSVYVKVSHSVPRAYAGSKYRVTVTFE